MANKIIRKKKLMKKILMKVHSEHKAKKERMNTMKISEKKVKKSSKNTVKTNLTWRLT